MTEWQPIETAPKDNTLVLLYAKIDPDPNFSDFMDVGYWETYNFWLGPVPPEGPCWNWSLSEHQPTHWMHLPEPPRQVGFGIPPLKEEGKPYRENQ